MASSHYETFLHRRPPSLGATDARDTVPAHAVNGVALTRWQLIQAQQELCRENGGFFFAPADGYCFSCGRDTVGPHWANTVVTGCGKCCRSFV